jgi:glutaredoxin
MGRITVYTTDGCRHCARVLGAIRAAYEDNKQAKQALENPPPEEQSTPPKTGESGEQGMQGNAGGKGDVASPFVSPAWEVFDDSDSERSDSEETQHRTVLEALAAGEIAQFVVNINVARWPSRREELVRLTGKKSVPQVCLRCLATGVFGGRFDVFHFSDPLLVFSSSFLLSRRSSSTKNTLGARR